MDPPADNGHDAMLASMPMIQVDIIEEQGSSYHIEPPLQHHRGTRPTNAWTPPHYGRARAPVEASSSAV